MISEEVYFNKGELYKKKTLKSGTVYSMEDVSSYYFMDWDNNIYHNEVYPIYAIKKYPDGTQRSKQYVPFPTLLRALNLRSDHVVDTSKLDLCPSVDLWVMCSTFITDKDYSDYCDLWFQVENATMLEKVAEYYKLPFPLEKGHTLDTYPADWHHEGIANRWRYFSNNKLWDKPNVRMGAITFLKGVPTYLKMYKFNPKDRNYACKSLELK